MILLTRTCFCLPLKWGALGTFAYSMVTSMVPLTSLHEYIFKISFDVFMLNTCQIAFAVFASIFAIIGTLLMKPHFILPFLTIYVGYALIDFASVIGTSLIGAPFYAHNLLKGGGLGKTKVSKTYLVFNIILFTAILAFRMYFTFIVYCFYEELKLSVEPDGSPENSEEAPPLSNSLKVSGKTSESEI